MSGDVLQGELDIVAAELEARGRGVRGDTGRLLEDLPTILAGTGANAPAQAHAHEPRLTMAGVAEGWTEQSELALEDLVVEVLAAELKGDDTRQPLLPGANLGAFGDEELRALRRAAQVRRDQRLRQAPSAARSDRPTPDGDRRTVQGRSGGRGQPAQVKAG